jgi:hypothetical protein
MNSVLSYPNRGPFGQSSYRGNCSGYIIKDLIEHYTKPNTSLLIVDPMEGGATSRDVCASLNTQGYKIDYVGLDLRHGFNILQDELRDKLPRPCDHLFIHPPYGEMIKYSGNVWGSKPVAGDLSHCASYTEFLSSLQIALQNAYRALRPGGHYSLLIGDLRKNNQYFFMAADLRQLAPGELAGVCIKQQHNCVSDQTSYGKRPIIRIAHEYLLTFRKPINTSTLDNALATSSRLNVLANANWKSLAETALRQLGGHATFEEICALIERNTPTGTKRPNWQTKVLGSLNKHAQLLDNDIWQWKEI